MVQTSKINLGCGGHYHDGYMNVDIDKRHRVDLRADVSDLWMLDDATFDEALASHILEHFPVDFIPYVLREWLRILKPNGWLEVRAPRLPAITENYIAGKCTVDVFFRPVSEEIYETPDLTSLARAYLAWDITAEDFSTEIFKHFRPGDRHYVIWDGASLSRLLVANGFVDAEVLPVDRPWTPDTATPGRTLPDTVIVRARKPIGATRKRPLFRLGIVMPELYEMPYHGYCSISKLVLALVPYFQRAGVQVHIFSIKENGPCEEVVDGVYYHRHEGTVTSYLQWIGGMADRLDIDIIEIYNRVWRIPTRAKVLIHMSNDHIREEDKSVIAEADAVTMISQYLLDQTAARMPEFTNKFYLNHLGVDTKEYHPVEKEQPPILLWLGLMDRTKGLDHFVAVANRLCGDFPDLGVRLVGPAALKEGVVMTDYIRRCMADADPRFDWVGKVPTSALAEHCGKASVLMAPMNFPYTWSLAIMEAQACGTPAVIGNVGGLSECVEPLGGFICSPGDGYREELYRKCKELLGDETLRMEASAAARRTALKFTWAETASGALRLYDQILGDDTMPYNEVACVILDWKRPQNMDAVLAGVRGQDIDVDIYVVHQDNDRRYDDCFNIWLESNLGSGTKFSVLPLIPNRYVAIIDDDLELVDPGTFALMLSHVRQYGFVGSVGVILGSDPDRPYTSGGKINATEVPTPCDILLTNCVMLDNYEAQGIWGANIELIRSIQFDKTGILANEDPIYSLLFSQTGRKPHVVGTGTSPYKVLDTAHGLEHTEIHYASRDANVKFLLAHMNMTDTQRKFRLRTPNGIAS